MANKSIITYDMAKKDYADLNMLSLEEVNKYCEEGDQMNILLWDKVQRKEITEKDYYNSHSVICSYIRWHYALANDKREKVAELCKGNVLNFGCGIASESLIASKNENVNSITLYDISEECFRYIKYQILKYRLDKIYLYNEYFDVYGNNFDTILCLDVLEHFNDPKRILKELSYLLKSTGKLIIRAPFHHSAPAHRKENAHLRINNLILELGIMPENWIEVEI